MTAVGRKQAYCPCFRNGEIAARYVRLRPGAADQQCELWYVGVISDDWRRIVKQNYGGASRKTAGCHRIRNRRRCGHYGLEESPAIVRSFLCPSYFFKKISKKGFYVFVAALQTR